MRYTICILFAFISNLAYTQSIPANRVVTNEELIGWLKDDVRDQLSSHGEISTKELAAYFRQKFSERFFYEYDTFHDRLPHYNSVFNKQEDHKTRALSRRSSAD